MRCVNRFKNFFSDVVVAVVAAIYRQRHPVIHIASACD